VFVNKWRINKRIFPRQVPRHPIANHGCKFPDLDIQTSVFPRSNTKHILIQPHLCTSIGRVKAAIEPRLNKKIELRSVLRVEKQSEARIKEIVDLAVDESGRWLIEMIRLQINRAAQARAQVVVKCRHRQCAIKSVEEIVDFNSTRGGGQETKAEGRERLHRTLTQVTD